MEKAALQQRIQFVIRIVVTLLVQNYIFQTALIVQTIQKHMVARQQTQLKHYLQEQHDPVFVVSVNEIEDGSTFF